MKNIKTIFSKWLLVLFLSGLTASVTAQIFPTLEWNNQGASTTVQGYAPNSANAVTSTSVTFYKNANNPTGNTFTPMATPITATISISEHFSSTYKTVFGAKFVAGSAVYQHSRDYIFVPMGGLASNYTASSLGTLGTGISPAANYGVNIYFPMDAMHGQAAVGRYKMATVTIAFSEAVDNPNIHINGIGRWVRGVSNLSSTEKDFYTEWELEDSSLSFDVLSGNSYFGTYTSPTGKKAITHTGYNGRTTPYKYDAASGTIKVNGTNITTMKFTVYMKSRNSHSWRVYNGDGTALNRLGQRTLFGISLDDPTPSTSTCTEPATYDYVSKQPGSWSSGSTWEGGSAPSGSNKNILIKHKVTYSSDLKPASGSTIVIKNGELEVNQLQTDNGAVTIILDNGNLTVDQKLQMKNTGDRICAVNSCITVGENWQFDGNSQMTFTNSGIKVGGNLQGSPTVSGSNYKVWVGQNMQVNTTSWTQTGVAAWYAGGDNPSGWTGESTSSMVPCDYVPPCNAGNTAPPVMQYLANTCPSTTVNLNDAHTGTVPTGVDLVWFNGTNPETDEFITDIATVGAGTYYAFYYDGDNDCWSPPSLAVTVTIDDCPDCTNSGETSVNLNSLFAGTLPDPTVVLQWWTSPTRDLDPLNPGTKVDDPTNVTASGTYYAFFHDTVNNCYNTDNSTAFVDVTILPPCDTTCTKPGDFTEDGIPTKVGITVQQRQDGWPQSIPNGFITLESKEKGFVITRVQNSDMIADAKEGMLIYDIDAKCVKLYNGTVWKCLEKSCNE